MGSTIKFLFVIGGLLFMLSIIYSIRKNSIKPAYALLWLVVSLFILSIPIFENLYKFLATQIIGFVNAQSLVFIVLITFLLVYNYYLTTKVSQLTDQNQQLISFTAILEKRINDIQYSKK